MPCFIYLTFTFCTLTYSVLIGNLSFSFKNRISVIFLACLSLISLIIISYHLMQILNKEKFIVIQKTLDKNYKSTLDNYLTIQDPILLQKYLRHDLLNHIQFLKVMKEEETNHE